MKFQRLAALAVYAVSFSVLCTAVSAQSDNGPTLGMVTGPKTGTYIAFGHDIAKVAEKNGLTINVYDSNGSIDNIKRITSKEKVGLAIIQSDVLGFLSRSKNPESIATADKLRLVAPFYDEEVHVLARSDIKTLADLAGKRVVVGSEGSGSMITAVNIFSTLGITPSKMFKIDPPRGVVAVLNNEVDAVVFVGGKPVKMFKNMEELANIKSGLNAGKLEQIHFVPIADQRLLKEYKPATLTHADYNFITADVPTVAVTAVLVTYDYKRKNGSYYEEQCSNMGKLAQVLKDNLGELKASGHPKWKEVDLSADIGNWKRDECTGTILSSSAAAGGDHAGSNTALEKDLIGVIRNKTP